MMIVHFVVFMSGILVVLFDVSDSIFPGRGLCPGFSLSVGLCPSTVGGVGEGWRIEVS